MTMFHFLIPPLGERVRVERLDWEECTISAGMSLWPSPFPWTLAFIMERLQVYFKMILLPCPFSAIVRKGYFSDLYLENLMESLKVKFMNMGCGRVQEGSPQDYGFRRSQSHTQSPAIHQNDHLRASPKI